MGKIIVLASLVVTCMYAQAFRDLLLPQTRHIVGMVVDPDGKPVVEAHIDHSDDRRQTHQTNSEGKFELDTRAPAFVIRKVGFRSELVQTPEASEMRITLQKLKKSPAFPICSSAGDYTGIDNWGASFQFPRTPGVKAGRQGRDIDYGTRSYYIHTKQGHKGIIHGSGSFWSFGMPLDQDVWRSVRYEEVTFEVGDLTIIDARGQLPNGHRWRNLTKFGESASYSDVDEADAKILDYFLNGACLKSQLPR